MMSAQLKSRAETAPLAARLKARIAREGMISVAAYMDACVADPDAGYYATRHPIGAQGDFITAPEISQIFGELLGLWAVAVWQSMGAPKPVTVAELGPGRGTLMADARRAWRSVPQFLEAVTVALIETSPSLRDVQQEALRGSPAQVQWFDRVEDMPQGPLIVIANEFLDALPVRQLVRRGVHWHERCVAVDRHDAFIFTEGNALQAEELPEAALALDAPDGAILEIRPGAERLMSALAARASEAPLVALFIDYGHDETGFGDTLQAVRNHAYADPLAASGEADLTAHVDFAALKRSAKAHGLDVYGPMPQGAFLLKLGLEARRDRLLAGATPAQRDSILSGAARLTDPRQMGALFKALVLTSDGLAPPPPFGDI
ncbi:MAG: class I SAM-dependent methyltransferase [Methyloceanibacter sp.]|nr:class I SAM-dependent methyltransferase [Methyloceanibacter sp.]